MSFVDIVQTVNIYTFCKYIVYIIQFSNLLLKTRYTAQCLVPLVAQKHLITSYTLTSPKALHQVTFQYYWSKHDSSMLQHNKAS